MLVDKFVTSGSTVGVGSGELVYTALALIGERLAANTLNNVTAIPSCDAAASSSAFNGVPLTTLEKAGRVDVYIEQVDQMDISANAAVKGQSQEPQQPPIVTLQKLSLASSKNVLLVENENMVERLGTTLPVVIKGGDEWEETAEELDDIFLGDGELWRRSNQPGSENPRAPEDPYVSADGHNIIDVKFEGPMLLFGEQADYSKLLDEVRSVKGVVSTGLMLQRASAVVVADGGEAEGEPKLFEFGSM